MGRSQRKTALELFERHSVGRALNKWKFALTRIQVSASRFVAAVLTRQSLGHQAADVRAKSDRITLRQALGTWIASERSKLLAQVHDTRLTRDCLGRWQNKRKSLQALEGRSQHKSRQQLTSSVCRRVSNPNRQTNLTRLSLQMARPPRSPSESNPPSRSDLRVENDLEIPSYMGIIIQESRE
jgi:hypothetical protein